MRIIAHINEPQDLINVSVVVGRYIEQGYKDSVVYTFNDGKALLVKPNKTGYTVYLENRDKVEEVQDEG
jgi:hypothetical protein